MFGKQKISEGERISFSAESPAASTSEIPASPVTQKNRIVDACECGGPLVRVGLCFSCLVCGWGGCS